MSVHNDEAFSGFPRKTLGFLAGLAASNNKDWFEAHRDDYEVHYLQPARAFVTAMGPRLRKLSPGIIAEPKVNGSLMRIHRDTRFAKDKTPYKDHLDLIFWEGEGKGRQCPGFFFRLTAKKLFLGAGKHGFDSSELAAYRAAIDDNRTGRQLVRALDKIPAAYTLGGQHYKKVPRGFAADHERGDLLRHNALHVAVEMKVPKEAHGAGFVDFCVDCFAVVAPIHRWLVATLAR